MPKEKDLHIAVPESGQQHNHRYHPQMHQHVRYEADAPLIRATPSDHDRTCVITNAKKQLQSHP
jgi:hypothetical protein